ncbi:MAG: exodeoxyribonuclease V subunit gamma, partial [Betaproteobacteria bacterium]
AKPLAAQVGGDGMHAATHPLLASWGKQGRDYLHLLDNFDDVQGYRQRMSRVDAFVDPVAGVASPTQLQCLQSSLLNLEPLPATPQPLSDDASICFVSTHSAQREVEVLQDQLLAWFDTDAQLQPRDVMVMVPAMEAFAPHIQAVFGRFAPGQPRHIPYSVADTTARQSPMVQALEHILSLPGSRVSLADWLSLFEVAAVRQRFGLSEGDVEQLTAWLNAAGVRWGLDAKHRKAWGVPADVPGLDQNTWAFGLRRLLLGYAVGGGEPWDQTVPQAGLGGLDAALISALLDWVDAISQTLRELSQPQTPAQWGVSLVNLVARFFEASDEAEERRLQRLLDPLEVWLQSCQEARLDTPLPLDVVREHWLSQIEDVGLHQRFFGGGVQFGTLMPMRSIPFQVICLIGMNDGDYPRQGAARDFDLMAQSWRAGDRSRREDDRYLFLEALLSARQRLYLSWQGHRATDNAEQPPSVLVAQLIDYLNACWTPARAPRQHPLQAYSQAYFLQGSAFSSYDLDWARVHAAAGADRPATELSPSPLPESLTLDELRQLLRHPVQVFFRQRLRVQLDSVEGQLEEVEPFALDPLQKFNVGQALLQASDASAALHKLQWSGQLPMSAFGDKEAAEFESKLSQVLARKDEWRAQFPDAVAPQSLALSLDGIAIRGDLTGVWSEPALAASAGDGTALLQLHTRLGAVLEGKGAAKIARGHVVVGLWVNHVVASACGLRLHSALLGVDGQVVFNALESHQAVAILQRWLQVWRAAWERPLPVACKTGWAFLQAQAKAQRQALDKPDKDAKDPHDAARAAFENGFQGRCELSESAYLARAFERYDDIEEELPAWAELLYGDMARHVAFSLTQEVSA